MTPRQVLTASRVWLSPHAFPRKGTAGARGALALACALAAAPVCAADTAALPPAGLSRESALSLGEAMYRRGELPSGESLQAFVQGDILVDGSMFSCDSCHMRSGLGSVEGTVLTPPTNGAVLFKPFKSGHAFTEHQREQLPAYFQVPDIRPAYTDATLAAVLQTGIDPSNRKLDPIMPRYMIAGRDLEIMIYYLKNLSSAESPGVTATTIRFATVVGEGVAAEDRDAMLLPLAAYLNDRNSLAPYFRARARNRLFSEEMDLSYRGPALATWLLKGPPGTWGEQLREYYRKDPVFALLGGIVPGSWAPIHEFCEQNRIPCVLPVTDQPVLSKGDWYTLYFSKGPYQEGAAAARFLKNKAGPVAQVYRRTDEGLRLAQGFRETGRAPGAPAAEEVVLAADEKPDAAFWTKLAERHRDGTLVLWLGSEDFAVLADLAGRFPSLTLVASATVLGDGLTTLPHVLRPRSWITHPYRLPGDRERLEHLVKPWLKTKKIPETNLAISSKMYFLGTMLTNVFMHLQRNYYRDYFLDVIDMLRDESDTIANYPRLSFGPGQRFASKGCYLVQLTDDEPAELLVKSDWVIH